MAQAALALTAISGLFSAYGAIQQGQAQQQAAEYQAQVAANNATIARQNANYELQKGAVETQNQGLKAKAAIGSELAAQGASGIDVDSGSPLSIRSSTAQLGRTDELTTNNNAQRRAYGYRTQATNFDAQAGLDRMTGDNAMTAGYISAGGSLLGTASSFASKWQSYSAIGAI